jgi:endonuclease-3
MKKADVYEFYTHLAQGRPNPTSDLEWTTTYTLLVAVVLSAQATDIGVNKATKKLFKTINSPEKMVALGEAKLKDHIKTIGLFNAKARNVIALSHLLIKEHNSKIPNDQAALELLPGVGRKTANVVRNIAFGEPTIAVDTHIFRVGNRTGLAPGKNVIEVENKLLKDTPKDFILHAHHWLILHGRYTCKARKPNCPSCDVSHLCQFKDKTTL